jgi:hypothetical protein
VCSDWPRKKDELLVLTNGEGVHPQRHLQRPEAACNDLILNAHFNTNLFIFGIFNGSIKKERAV